MKGKRRAQTLMSTFIRISLDPTCKCVGFILYRSMIRSLVYITITRLDIAFSVGMCARFQSNSKESHLTAIKRILKYLSATFDYDIWYSKDSNLSLVGYSEKAQQKVVFMLVEIWQYG